MVVIFAHLSEKILGLFCLSEGKDSFCRCVSNKIVKYYLNLYYKN